MRSLRTVPLLSGLVLAVLVQAGFVQRCRAEDAGPADRSFAEAGWAIDGISLRGTDRPGMRHLLATGRIDAPPWLVWNVVRNSGRENGDTAGIIETVAETANGDTAISRFKMAVPIYKDRRFRLRLVSDRERMSMQFEKIPGYGNVHEIRGRWIVGPSGDGASRLTYLLDTDPGVRLVPRFIVDWATRKAMPRLFASVHERCARISRRDSACSRGGSDRGAAID